MILKNSSNREVIKKYINNISEDDLIKKIIVPYYNYCGFSTLRIVDHGPGEHGKDIVFFRYSPALYDNEYIVIQAKAEKVKASNVVKMANQLIRAIRTPISGLSGGISFFPNYVIHFNSKSISNDADWEFPYLVDGKNNIKIIHQDNVVDLMMNSSIIPNEIKGEIDLSGDNSESSINSRIMEILFNNNSKDIDLFFKNILPISKKEIDDRIKRMIIDYIFKTWKEDKSWVGTVKPMKWLSSCYEFLQDDQANYLEEIIYEYTSSTPSFEAAEYTEIVFSSITETQYKIIRNYYIDRIIIDFSIGKLYIPLINKFMDFTTDDTNNNDHERFLRKSILRLREIQLERDITKELKEERSNIYDEIIRLNRLF